MRPSFDRASPASCRSVEALHAGIVNRIWPTLIAASNRGSGSRMGMLADFDRANSHFPDETPNHRVNEILAINAAANSVHFA